MKTDFRLRHGSVQSKVISILILAPTLLAFLFPISAFAIDYAPSLPNANVFSADFDAPRVDDPTGAFTQRLQLDIPPGRNGLQPDVALQYNSQNTTDGIVGYGWTLSTPYIERINKYGTQSLYSSNQYFTSSIDGELTPEATTTYVVANGQATIADTLNLTDHQFGGGANPNTFSYTVPSGSNQVLVILIGAGFNTAPTITLNERSFTVVSNRTAGLCDDTLSANMWFAYLANPTSGTVSITKPSSIYGFDAIAMTINGANTANPIDAYYCTGHGSGNANISISTTTPTANDLLLSHSINGNSYGGSSHGAGQTEIASQSSWNPVLTMYASYVAGSSTPNTLQGVSETWSNTTGLLEEQIVAIKAATGTVAVNTYTQNYRARVDSGSGNYYSYATSTNTWTVYDKKGTKYTFGSSDPGRMYDTNTGTSTNTYRWYLQEIRDTNNNYITYTYNTDNNVVYPYKITYTGNGSTDGISTITFATSTRNDTRVRYATGFVATTTKVISKISASVNGSVARNYNLNYGIGHNGYRSLLTSVFQQGYDENNVLTSVPGTIFTYEATTTQFYAPGSQQLHNSSYVVADANGDGTNDTVTLVINSGTGVKNWNVYPQGSASGASSGSIFDTWSSTYGGPGSITPEERGLQLIDANGDGKADIIQGFTATTSSVNINTYSTTTSVYSWTASSSYSGYVPIFAYNGGQVSTGLFGNFNGDSLPDYVQSTPSYSDSYLGNGSAWNITTYFDGPKQFPSPGSSEPASQLIDLNSDGLDDWVYSEGNKIYALMNNGTGWNSSPSPQWTISTSTLYDDPSSSNYNDRGIRFMDLNGDGFPDFVRSYQIQSGCSGMEIADYKAVYLNTGNGWATSTAYTLPAYITYCDGSTVTHNEYANFNGNGQMKQDVLTKVTNTKGGTVTVDYSIPSITLNPELAFPLLTVNTIATGDGLGNYSTTTYQYAEGRMYLTSGPRDRKFAGFAIATTTNPDSIVATYYNQGYGLNSERGEQSDGFGQINKPYRRDILDSSGNKKQRTFYRWDTATSGNSTFVGLGREMTWDFASDGSHRDKATDYRYASSTGDLIQKTEYGEVNGSADGTFNYRFWVR